MASDHRGRDLHAGKRTAQEMGWKVPFAPDDSTGRFQAHKPVGKYGRMLVNRYEEGDPTSWEVALPKIGDGSDIPSGIDGPVDLGRGKTAKTSYGSDRYANDVDRGVVKGTASTHARAMIKAEAMNKRIQEGRDLKTGRPKK
jgi:hypothetical protein